MRQFLEHVTGLSIYPLISFFIFIVLFLAASYYAFFVRKEVIEQMSNLPLESNAPTQQ